MPSSRGSFFSVRKLTNFIGEVIPTYSAINNEPRIPTWPVSMPKRWNVLLDSFIVGTQTIGVSTNVSGAPSQKAVVLLDSGTSWT